MQNVTDIITLCGGAKALAASIGVTPDAVRKSAAAGKMPAMWFDAIERKIGAPLPRHLFSFKGQDE